jgi:sortase A
VTRFSCAAPWLRRGEIALAVVGLSLIGWALAATLITRNYQARQERALFIDLKRGPVVRESVDPLVLGRIEIPRIGVMAIVREGDDDATLAIAVGHIAGTAKLGERGNMALAGHRDSFFRPLQGIRPRDSIRMVTPTRSWEYVVDSTAVVGPDETRVLDPTSDTVLTLVTCYPFKYVGHAPNRFIVRASLVAPRPVVVAGKREETPASAALGRGARTQR